MENEVKKLSSPWSNSHFSLKDSEWLAENVEGVDRSIKEILQLFGQDVDITMEKIDIDLLKQPELIAHIKEISNRHHILADHYSKLRGELCSYILSTTEMHNHEGNIFVSKPNSSMLTPDKKLGIHNVGGQVVGSDLSLSSGGGISDISLNEGSESSSLSSDSDSEAYYSCPRLSSLQSGKMWKHKVGDMESELFPKMERVVALSKPKHAEDSMKVEGNSADEMLRRILELEEEFKVSNQKLQFAEEEIIKLKRELQKNEAVLDTISSIEAQLVSAKNQIKLHEAEIEMENMKSLTLHGHVIELEDKLESKERQVLELRGTVTKYTAELSDRNLEIRKLTAELQDASGNFALEKWQLESSICNLSERVTFHEARTEELQTQCELLAVEIKTCEAENFELERKQETLAISWHDDVERMNADICKKNEIVETLNKDLDGLKLKYDMLMVEKNEVNAKLQILNANLSNRENRIQHLEFNLLELHSENERINEGSESANRLTAELKSKINELEKEVESQKVLISDRAEEKREAIRQLCLSVDHFKGAYEELRAYVKNKRPTVLVL